MAGKIKRFRALTDRERCLFLEALVLQLWVGLLLKAIPFRWIPKLFAGCQSPVGSQQSAVPDISYLQQIKTATQRASRVSPWKNKCLVSSLAASRMLNKRKIASQLSLGVTRGADSTLTAHAWLRSGDTEIVEKRGDYAELHLF